MNNLFAAVARTALRHFTRLATFPVTTLKGREHLVEMERQVERRATGD